MAVPSRNNVSSMGRTPPDEMRAWPKYGGGRRQPPRRTLSFAGSQAEDFLVGKGGAAAAAKEQRHHQDTYSGAHAAYPQYTQVPRLNAVP
ncbi:hypothetical protein CCHR01_05561 [Colletotrichum chrysophilum]|uniref:Uncharacterized protein n=1 Tax=Colletotrichum chrysophilum TaxID=1836956 RepID=A0AAD9AS80_9PEZI|nr:hypothetical protein CCHR01_05561 [Colletotrichum chrysophilum]